MIVSYRVTGSVAATAREFWLWLLITALILAAAGPLTLTAINNLEHVDRQRLHQGPGWRLREVCGARLVHLRHVGLHLRQRRHERRRLMSERGLRGGSRHVGRSRRRHDKRRRRSDALVVHVVGAP